MVALLKPQLIRIKPSLVTEKRKLAPKEFLQNTIKHIATGEKLESRGGFG